MKNLDTGIYCIFESTRIKTTLSKYDEKIKNTYLFLIKYKKRPTIITKMIIVGLLVYFKEYI